MSREGRCSGWAQDIVSILLLLSTLAALELVLEHTPDELEYSAFYFDGSAEYRKVKGSAARCSVALDVDEAAARRRFEWCLLQREVARSEWIDQQ